MASIDLARVSVDIRRWLEEDLGSGDITTSLTVRQDQEGRAEFVMKEGGCLCGLSVAERVFSEVDAGVTFSYLQKEGDLVSPGSVVAQVSGSLSSILAAERLSLNLLQRLSGVATLTRGFVNVVSGTSAKILDTRKTTPGLRVLEKYAVRVGGGHNHRFGLYDGILIKDNHVHAAGGVAAVLNRAKKGAPHYLAIEVEVGSLDELEEALSMGAPAILLDNMCTTDMETAVKITRGRAVLEASGNMSLERVREVALTGVDLISVGALTHSAPALDISLKFR